LGNQLLIHATDIFRKNHFQAKDRLKKIR